MRVSRHGPRATALLATMAIVTTGASVSVAAPNERAANSTVSILHAIPDLESSDSIDVYADSNLIAEALSPGDLATTRIKPGKYDITVVEHDASPSNAISIVDVQNVRFRPDANHTVALHLSPTMGSTATVFTNNTRTEGRDMGRLTVRHIAQAPMVDIRSRGSVLLDGVRPGTEQDIGLRSGEYRVRIARADTRRAVVPPSDHRIVNAPGRQDMGDNRILYLWGSTANGSLDVAVQEIPLDLR